MKTIKHNTNTIKHLHLCNLERRKALKIFKNLGMVGLADVAGLMNLSDLTNLTNLANLANLANLVDLTSLANLESLAKNSNLSYLWNHKKDSALESSLSDETTKQPINTEYRQEFMPLSYSFCKLLCVYLFYLLFHHLPTKATRQSINPI